MPCLSSSGSGSGGGGSGGGSGGDGDDNGGGGSGSIVTIDSGGWFRTWSSYLFVVLLSGSVMVVIILLARRFHINPDNIATPIAGSLGDLMTVSLLAAISMFIFRILGMFCLQIYLVCTHSED